jgi:hypothetical protein
MNDETQKTKMGSLTWLRVIFFGCASLATLIALFYAEEDLRGKYDWNQYKRELEAKGAKFDHMDFVPAPVPDDQNFALSPVWVASLKYFWQRDLLKRAEAWYGDRVNDEEVAKFFELMPISPSALVGTNLASYPQTMPQFQQGWTAGHMVDLKVWQSYYRNLEKNNPAAGISLTPLPQSPAADVLLALSKFDPAIEQLRADSQRPYSRFPVQYDVDDPAEILLPHLAVVKQSAEVLELRAIAELQNGQTDKAFDDIKLTMRLADSIRTEPFIITHLVRMAIMQMAIQGMYEGLAQHAWSDAQLKEFDSELGSLDYLADYQFSIHYESAAHVKIFQWLEEKRSRCMELLDMMSSGRNGDAQAHAIAWGFYLMPKGWFYQGDVLLSRVDEAQISVPDDAQHLLSPERLLEADKVIKKLFSRHAPFNVLGRMMAPGLETYARRTAFAQESADLARVAIALERCRLALGTYPDSLDVLAPKFMSAVPADIINGEPLHYHLTSDGQFILYSVGWNEKDDGGIAYRGNPMGGGIDLDKGDWVWRYPKK